MIKNDIIEFKEKIPLRHLASNPNFANQEELL